MNKRITKAKTDFQIVAEACGVGVYAVKKALQRRDEYPNNRLVKAYDRLQGIKSKAVKKIAA